MALEKQLPDKLMVAAIDFGTTYTGMGYSMLHTFKTDPTRVWTKHWGRSGGGPALVSTKTPTCLLLTPEKEFHAFGYDAEDKYSDLSQENKHQGWYYFKNFKMTLYHEKIDRSTTLSSDQNLELPAIDIFSHSIAFIKRELLKEMDNKGILNKTNTTEGEKIREAEIGWVLTVPAIWNYSAKQFMREAAKKAGIPTEQLTLALEPEAASVYVKEMNVKKQIVGDEASLSPYDPGTRYMVLDMGGGTVDVTVREVLDGPEGRTLKEVTKASGGAWGGLRVNEEIFKYLEEIFSAELLSKLKLEHTNDFLELDRNIEHVKRRTQTDGKGRFGLQLPMELREMFESKFGKPLAEMIGNLKLSHPSEIVKDKLKFKMELIVKFFTPCVESIIKHCREMSDSELGKDISDIIMVGGFAESQFMQMLIHKAFPETSIIIPQEAGLIVLKGAVIYGHFPRVVSCRVVSKTIGVRNLRYFLEGTDPEEKRTVIGGISYCKDIFNKLCEAGEEFMLGEKVAHEVYPLRADMTEMTLNLYQTDDREPKYTTDEGCEEIGKMLVAMEDITRGMERIVDVSLEFGDTELIVQGIDRDTKKATQVHLDLLSKKK